MSMAPKAETLSCESSLGSRRSLLAPACRDRDRLQGRLAMGNEAPSAAQPRPPSWQSWRKLAAISIDAGSRPKPTAGPAPERAGTQSCLIEPQSRGLVSQAREVGRRLTDPQRRGPGLATKRAYRALRDAREPRGWLRLVSPGAQ